ncbi:hypothetical protein BDZ90DRAFT_116356 [Jaminaea rosea]|uniref:Uncharacterized protein n=1 Tax=Jaminaea rosea TaxID=1569628 RepID=A0A316UXX1_9BASI|nr:hypothetical protein BDZ90DRAFT_116356 [Jaminaea rosea]PWN29638.1 hypothetical protein BDZ90DRAFT_116356 [Jaminaea rosea]
MTLCLCPSAFGSLSHGAAIHVLFILLTVIAVRAVDIGPDKAGEVLDAPDTIVEAFVPRAAPSAQIPSSPFSIGGGGTGQAIAPDDWQAGNVVEGAGAGSSKAAQPSAATTSASACPPPPAATTNTSGITPQEDRYIKIAGILVPAIVAIGLGIAGMIVTLHVNAPRREEDNDYQSARM